MTARGWTQERVARVLGYADPSGARWAEGSNGSTPNASPPDLRLKVTRQARGDILRRVKVGIGKLLGAVEQGERTNPGLSVAADSDLTKDERYEYRLMAEEPQS